MTHFERSAIALICNLSWRFSVFKGARVKDITFLVTTQSDARRKRWFRVHEISLDRISMTMEGGNQYRVWNEEPVQVYRTKIKTQDSNHVNIYLSDLGTTYVTGTGDRGNFVVELDSSYTVKVTDQEDGRGVYKYEISLG